MIDTSTNKGRIVAALLRVATHKRWHDVSLLDVAEEAGISLLDLRKEFERKSQMLSSFGHMVDAEVIRKLPRRIPGQAPRDAIFEVVMARFDVLQAYKAALKMISEWGGIDGSLLKSLLRSQTAMLQAAGIDTEGPTGKLRVAGLAGVFTRTFAVWLDDSDPGMARTMALLDRQLRSGERTLTMVDNAFDSLHRFRDRMRQRSGTSHGSDRSASTASTSPPSSEPPMGDPMTPPVTPLM